MDEASHRIMPAQLSAMMRCREIREEHALQQLHADRRGFESALVCEQQAQEDATRATAMRDFAERTIYARLSSAGPLSVGMLLEGREAVAGLTAKLEAAERVVEDKRDERIDAEHALEESRKSHALRSRDVSKWRTLSENAATARLSEAESAEELEVEEQAGLTFSAQRGRRLA
jgi:Type III secretion protein YscO